MNRELELEWRNLKRYTVSGEDRSKLLRLTDAVINQKQDVPPGTFPPVEKLIKSMAASRSYVKGITRPIKVGVVFAMWREARRIAPRSSSNPNGEDSINEKLRTLDWLFRGTSVDWHLYAVDDDCPAGSHEAARSAVRGSPFESKLTVLELAKDWPFESAPLNRMKSVSESTKGGAIVYGLQTAIEHGCEYVCYTDCDNAVHLGELGNLMAEVVSGPYDGAFGNSEVPGNGSTWHPMRGSENASVRLLSHIRRLMLKFRPPSQLMADPFKLFRSSYLRDSLSRLQAFDFSFDYWMMLGLVADGRPLKLLPFSFFDSYEESSWHSLGNPLVEFQKTTGLLRALRALELPYDEVLAAAVDKYISSPQHVEKILLSEGPRQMGDTRKPLGSCELMPVPEVVLFVESLFKNGRNLNDW